MIKQNMHKDKDYIIKKVNTTDLNDEQKEILRQIVIETENEIIEENNEIIEKGKTIKLLEDKDEENKKLEEENKNKDDETKKLEEDKKKLEDEKLKEEEEYNKKYPYIDTYKDIINKRLTNQKGRPYNEYIYISADGKTYYETKNINVDVADFKDKTKIKYDDNKIKEILDDSKKNKYILVRNHKTNKANGYLLNLSILRKLSKKNDDGVRKRSYPDEVNFNTALRLINEFLKNSKK
jgi:hypothetical protein